MRSDLARGPVNLQPPQRPGFDDYKKTSSGSYTSGTRQPSAGRKPPQGKHVLPEFPRRDDGTGYRQGSVAVGGNYSSSSVATCGGDHTRVAIGSTGTYTNLTGAGRSTSVPRPSSRTGAPSQVVAGVAGGGCSGGGGPSHAAAATAGAAAAAAAAHTSPRGAAPRPSPAVPGSILDTLTTPSVLSSATRSSLAQRMNSSSIMDYGMLAGGTSGSAVRIKRQAGSVSGDATAAAAVVAAAATAAATGATAPGSPSPHYSSLPHPTEQLRPIYLSGPAAGTSGVGGVGTGGGVGVVAGGTIASAGRRASAERSAVERILSRASSMSSQSGGSYSAGPGGPPSPVAGSGLCLPGPGLGAAAVAPSAPSLPVACSSASSYHSAVDTQPPRLAGGTVYASQYAHQYGSQVSTVYIPNFSQHPPLGGDLYGSAGGCTGGGAAAQHTQLPPPRPAALPVSPTAPPLPPVVLSPTAVSSSAALHRSGSTTLASRPVIGAGSSSGGGAAATTAAGIAGRLRSLAIGPIDDDCASADGSSNSSIRRLQMQDDHQPRRSGNGAPLPPTTAAPVLAAAQYSATTTSAVASKPAIASAAAAVIPSSASALDYHNTHALTRPQQSGAQQQWHPQQQQQHPQQQLQTYPHAHPNPTLGGVAGGVGFPVGAVLEGGGSSYASTASSNASSGSSSSSSSKSSVAVPGTGVSSTTTSRTASGISLRSIANAASHGLHGGAGGAAAVTVAAATPQPPARPRQRTAVAAADSVNSAVDGSVRSSAEALGGALARTQPGAAAAAAGSGSGSGSEPSPVLSRGRVESGPVCGPLPDLPLVVAPRDASPGCGCVGLQNLGNTCFMNSILQSLNAVPELVQQFLNPSDRHWSSKAVVAPAYSGLVREMISGAHGSCVNPSAFLRKVSKHDSRWGDGRQQDSQEFLNSLLEALEAECNRITSKPVYRELQGKGSEEAQAAEAYNYARSWNDSVVDDIFGGLTQSTIQCHACKRVSHTFEPFLGLAVPIPSSGGLITDPDGGGGGGSGSGSVSVADCLRAFVECEELQGDDSYKCEACKRHQPHSKRMQIFRPPRVLVLTLKRFAQRPAAPGLFSRFRSPAKNNTPVRLESDPLDLAPYCNPLGLRGLCVGGGAPVAPLYQLVAVSHHSGSLEGGHYTAQARSCLDGQWYNFNDSCVRREPGRPSGSSSSAYVLFYRLAGLSPPAHASSSL